MQTRPRITFRDIRHSRALDKDVRELIEKLETYYDRIVSCIVLIELVQRHHEGGNRFHVRIDMTVPGETIVASHDANLHGNARDLAAQKLTKTTELDPGHVHARVAIHDAFETARRQLQDFARRQRRPVRGPRVRRRAVRESAPVGDR